MNIVKGIEREGGRGEGGRERGRGGGGREGGKYPYAGEKHKYDSFIDQFCT